MPLLIGLASAGRDPPPKSVCLDLQVGEFRRLRRDRLLQVGKLRLRGWKVILGNRRRRLARVRGRGSAREDRRGKLRGTTPSGQSDPECE